MANVEKRIRNGRERWYARYRDPDGRQRVKVFDSEKTAKNFVTTIAADVIRGSYVDPDAGNVTFKTYAVQWLDIQTFDRSTQDAVRLRFEKHVYPVLGARRLNTIKPTMIQAWIKGLDNLSPAYRRTLYANVSTVFSAAVDDEKIAKNPCRAASVRRPKVEQRKVIPWTVERVLGVHDALPERYRILATLGAGLGLRQGELFGLSPDDVDFLRGSVEVKRQVKLFKGSAQAFALPKGRKTRTVPLPDHIRDELAAHLATFPARPVTLPWATPEGAPVTVSLIVSTRENSSVGRNYFNQLIWKKALVKAGVQPSRENGCHALRHFYASTLLDAGESIKVVSEYLGHADAGFTLRTYTHLMPASGERAKKAIDSAFRVLAVYRATGSGD